MGLAWMGVARLGVARRNTYSLNKVMISNAGASEHDVHFYWNCYCPFIVDLKSKVPVPLR